MHVYDLQHVTKIFPARSIPANDDISLQIHEGEIFGLLGDNGAGKSTLIRQMVNLLASTSGQISFYGEPLESLTTAVAQRVGFMPQNRAPVTSLLVGEAIYYTAHLRGLSRKAALLEREQLLHLWGLEHAKNIPVGRISGGEGRLLQLSLAMAGSPPVLILDEPTNELAPQRRKQVWETLRTLNQTQGTTILFITHDAIEAEKIIQRVGILHAGRLLALGTPSDLKRQIDHQLRLELFFAPEQTPDLPNDLTIRSIDAGHWLVYLERNQVESVLARLDMQQIDDFRLYSATLEDLYMHVAGKDDKVTGWISQDERMTKRQGAGQCR